MFTTATGMQELGSGQNFLRATLAFTLSLAACHSNASSLPSIAPNSAQSAASQSRIVKLTLGITHTQHSLDSWGNAASVVRGEAVLRATTVVQNQSIMGWGATNPEPYPNRYVWSDLDRRIALMRRTRAVMQLTLCCAPDWMKGGKPGTTNWNRLAVAPYPAHYKDFAALAVAIARRYPDVKQFAVWNELKGFWDRKLNRWNYEAYTSLYNDVYDALKAVSPDIAVGGPYVSFDEYLHAQSNPSPVHGPYGRIDQRDLDVITYWLAHKHGADFITFDAGTAARDGNPPDWFTATQVYSDLDRWVAARTSLPIHWAEWYSSKYASSGNGVLFDHARQDAQSSATLVAMASSGASVELRWQPQGDDCCGYQGDQESVWSDTLVAKGGKAFPFSATLAAFRRAFPPGTALIDIKTPDTDASILASVNTLMVVNGLPYSRSITVNGRRISVVPFGVVFLSQPSLFQRSP